MTQIALVTVTTCLLSLFITLGELYVPRTKWIMFSTANCILNSSFISTPVPLITLGGRRTAKNICLHEPSFGWLHDHLPCQAINSSTELMYGRSFRGCLCVQVVREAIRSQHLAKCTKIPFNVIYTVMNLNRTASLRFPNVLILSLEVLNSKWIIQIYICLSIRKYISVLVSNQWSSVTSATLKYKQSAIYIISQLIKILGGTR